ncbi:hypothetical protein J437_LFUL012775 [Ladona fulva]|uniref:Uncharacterized protein n=1 Tax=Ladona fulva TaxID=123851 RepID=A0A8K0KCH9_LADFU|nr:hypothetical protein J437_LFUL012775 [Ladona fulva]
MNMTSGPSRYHDEDSRDSLGDAEEPSVVDSALSKRAQEVKEKREDDTYSWLMRALEVSFEYFKDQELDKVVAELKEMMEKFCYQDLENNENKAMFERFCRLQPVKSTPEGFSYKEEFEKYKKAEWKLERKHARNHQKYKRFLDRIKELEKAKQQSQTDAIAVD